MSSNIVGQSAGDVADRSDEHHDLSREMWEAGATPADLLEANLDLVRWFAHRRCNGTKRPDLFEVMFQSACAGFLKAFKNRSWDPDKGSLMTFVGYHMLNECQRKVDAKERYSLAVSSGAVVGDLALLMERLPKLVSLEYDLSGTGDGSFTRADTIADEVDDIDDLIEAISDDQDMRRVKQAIERIPPRYREALMLSLSHPSHRQAGMAVGVSAMTMNNRWNVAVLLLKRELGMDLGLDGLGPSARAAWFKHLRREALEQIDPKVRSFGQLSVSDRVRYYALLDKLGLPRSEWKLK